MKTYKTWIDWDGLLTDSRVVDGFYVWEPVTPYGDKCTVKQESQQ